jgi:DNA-binding NarL/FixJ family response regulator
MSEKNISIALIDDHHLLAESLSKNLSRYDFVGDIKIFKNPKEYLTAAHSPEPDIIISDILMPEMSGIDLLLHFKKQHKKVKIIMLSSITEVQTIRHAMRSGASGYLTKDTTSDELADALLTVYHGEPYIGESLRNSLIRNTFTEDRFVYNLSPREKEVLKLVCSGKTIKEAAYDMELSVNTVQTYYKAILKKFNLNRTADLIVFAMQNGLYNPQEENK